MRTLTLISGVLLLLCYSCSGGDKADKRPTLLVSIEPQRALLQEIAGPEYDVVTLLPSGADPENFDPSMSVRRSGADARYYFATGAFPFEHTMAAALRCSTIFATDGLELIYGTHGHEHAHHEHGEDHRDSGADPHIWTSVRNMKVMAGEMTNSLARLKPDSAAVYQARFEKLSERLDSLDAHIARTVSGTRSFAIWHPSLSYFARDYGLHQHAMGLEGKDMGVRQIRSTIDAATADSVRVFIIEAGTDPARAQTLAANMGARTIQINLMTPQWEQELTRLADEISSDTAQ